MADNITHLRRDCQGILIPIGTEIILKKGPPLAPKRNLEKEPAAGAEEKILKKSPPLAPKKQAFNISQILY